MQRALVLSRAARVSLAAGLVVAAGCGAARGDDAAPAASPAVTATPTTTVPTRPAPVARPHYRHQRHVRPAPVVTTPVPPTATAARPAFRWHATTVTARSLGASWHRGCPVGPSSLRAVSLTYWGFDRAAHRGTLIVASANVTATVAAFRAMYAGRFPIRQIRPVSAYGGSDDRSMAHDNTSAFNCRYAVSNGPKHWSMHAYGGAIDINPRENPYRLNGEVLPPEGEPYMDRSDVRRGMIVEGSVPVRAFSAVGWGWGGRWSSTPDYQHFSSTGG
jgi:hypothetical protein